MPAALPSALAPRCARRRPTTRLRKRAALGESCPQDQCSANPIVLASFARPHLVPRDDRSVAIQHFRPQQLVNHLGEHAPLKVAEGYTAHCRLQVHRDLTRTRSSLPPVSTPRYVPPDSRAHFREAACRGRRVDRRSAKSSDTSPAPPSYPHRPPSLLAPLQNADDSQRAGKHRHDKHRADGAYSAESGALPELDDAPGRAARNPCALAALQNPPAAQQVEGG